MSVPASSLPTEVQTALAVALITSIIAPLILLLAQKILNRQSNNMDMTKKALEAAGDAVDQLNAAREELKKRDEEMRMMEEIHKQDIAVLNREIELLKQALIGKYKICLELKTGADPSITGYNITLVTNEPPPMVPEPVGAE